MPFVERDASNRIVAVYSEPRANAGEELPADALELAEFLGAASEARRALTALDAELVRVIEDVIDVLIGKGLILPTDLPSAVQEKLSERRQVRERIVEGTFMVASRDII